MSIADTPEPPYYSVTTTALFNENVDGYIKTAMQLVEIAKSTEGFIGIETSLQPDCGIAISYWTSLKSIQAWKVSEKHMAAKQQARDKWFSNYITRIAKVERAY